VRASAVALMRMLGGVVWRRTTCAMTTRWTGSDRHDSCWPGMPDERTHGLNEVAPAEATPYGLTRAAAVAIVNSNLRNMAPQEGNI